MKAQLPKIVRLWREGAKVLSRAKRGISTYQALSVEILPRFARQDMSLARKRQRLVQWLLMLLLLWLSSDILYRRLGARQLPSQVEGPAVYGLLALNMWVFFRLICEHFHCFSTKTARRHID